MRQLYLLIGIVLMGATVHSAAESPRYRGDAEETKGTIWQTPQAATPKTESVADPKWQAPNIAAYPSQGSDTSEPPRYRPLTAPQTVTLPELPRPVTPSTDNTPGYPNVQNYPYYGAPNSNNYPTLQSYPENTTPPPPANLPNQPYNSSNYPVR
ncbi:MAG: hypothetical protein PHP00_14980 [Thiotrichaceae bacterium]|nr:hypothetical protein [Thiotrichaceae bacterium]